MRHYPHGPLAAQLLGYVSEVSPQELKQPPTGVRAGDKIGQSGIESAFDAYLRGVPGLQRLRVDSLGRPRGPVKTTLQNRPGRAVRPTLDLKLQQAAERALAYGIQRARDSNCYGCWDANGGAIVALDPHDGSVLALASAPTYNPGVYSGRVTTKALADAGTDDRRPPRRRTTRRSTARSSPGIRPARRSSPSRRSPRCSSTSSRRTRPRVHGLVHVAARPWASGLQELGPVRQRVDRPADGARALVRHVLLPTRRRVLRTAGERRPPAAGLGGELRLRPADRDRRRPRVRRSAADSRVAAEALQLGARQAVEAGRLDPARDRPEGPARHADADGALLRAGRQRRQARDAAPARSASSSPSPAGAAPHPAAPAPQQIGIDPAALDVVREGCSRPRTRRSARRPPSSAASPSRSPARPARRRRQSTPGTGSRGSSTSRGGAATGPYDNPSIVVCALIENGGHGGTAAAPAALKVFEQFFNEKAPVVGAIHSD